jgi:hypothetical protein
MVIPWCYRISLNKPTIADYIRSLVKCFDAYSKYQQALCIKTIFKNVKLHPKIAVTVRMCEITNMGCIFW